MYRQKAPNAGCDDKVILTNKAKTITQVLNGENWWSSWLWVERKKNVIITDKDFLSHAQTIKRNSKTLKQRLLKFKVNVLKNITNLESYSVITITNLDRNNYGIVQTVQDNIVKQHFTAILHNVFYIPVNSSLSL